MVIRPREARTVSSRILRQADWDWGLEPAVTAFVLAAEREGLAGMAMLASDWPVIRRAEPERMTAAVGPDAIEFDAAGCHAFVAAPSILDYLVLHSRQHPTVIRVSECPSAPMLAVLRHFGPRYGLRIELQQSTDRTACVRGALVDNGESTDRLELLRCDVVIDPAVWASLTRMASDYMVPESPVSRSHAGDGTRAFPIAGKDTSSAPEQKDADDMDQLR